MGPDLKATKAELPNSFFGVFVCRREDNRVVSTQYLVIVIILTTVPVVSFAINSYEVSHMDCDSRC